MTVKPISHAASRILSAMIAIEEQHGRGAKWQELADAVDRGLGTVQDHVKSLIAKDYVERRGDYYTLHAKRNPDGTLRRRHAHVEWKADDGSILHGTVGASDLEDAPEAGEGAERRHLVVVGAPLPTLGLNAGDLVEIDPTRHASPGEPSVAGRPIIRKYILVR